VSGRAIRAARRGKRQRQDLLAELSDDFEPATPEQPEDDTRPIVLSTGERIDTRSAWAFPNSHERQA